MSDAKSPPTSESISPTKPKLMPFTSATDSTLHRPVWRSTRAIEPSPRSPRRPPSRFRGQLRYDLLGPLLSPQEPVMPTSPAFEGESPRSDNLESPPSPTPDAQNTADKSTTKPVDSNSAGAEKGGNALAKSTLTNLEDLRWLEHQWLDRHGKSSNLKATREQLALMRRWFDSLDTDGSGEVGLAELEDPLVSVGLASSREDVQQLIEEVGPSGSGGVTFDAFLNLLYPERLKRDRRPSFPVPLHTPKHGPPERPETSPRPSSRSSPRLRQKSGAKVNANPVAHLFEDLQAGKLGDLAIPFPVLITAYRRRMLLAAHMAEDPSAKRYVFLWFVEKSLAERY